MLNEYVISTLTSDMECICPENQLPVIASCLNIQFTFLSLDVQRLRIGYIHTTYATYVSLALQKAIIMLLTSMMLGTAIEPTALSTFLFRDSRSPSSSSIPTFGTNTTNAQIPMNTCIATRLVHQVIGCNAVKILYLHQLCWYLGTLQQLLQTLCCLIPAVQRHKYQLNSCMTNFSSTPAVNISLIHID